MKWKQKKKKLKTWVKIEKMHRIKKIIFFINYKMFEITKDTWEKM